MGGIDFLSKERSLGQESALREQKTKQTPLSPLTLSLVLHLKENLLEALFSLIKVTLLYWAKLGLGTLITLCAIGSSVPEGSSNQAVESG